MITFLVNKYENTITVFVAAEIQKKGYRATWFCWKL